MNNERCFFEQGAWKEVLESLILDDPNIADRSEIVISLHILKSSVSSIFTDVQAFICNPDPNPRASNSNSNSHVQTLSKLTTRTQAQRTALLQWRHNHHPLLSRPATEGTDILGYTKCCEISATYYTCMMMTNRLLAALSLPESQSLEQETQNMARRLVEMEREVGLLESHARVFMAQALLVARAMLATGEEWENNGRRMMDWREGRGGVVEGGAFERWCGLFGRRVGEVSGRHSCSLARMDGV
jgi:hypothetical protein